MKTDLSIGTMVIVAFIVIALLIAVTTSVQKGQTLTDINNESIAMTGNVTGNFANIDISVVTTLLNGSTGNDISTICNVTLLTGAIVCDDVNAPENELLSNYSVFPSTYVKERGARTLVILISLILVIAVIIGFIKSYITRTK